MSIDKEFETKLMDYSGDRYNMVVLATMWAKELRKKEEYKSQPAAVVIKVALDDILSNKVTKEQVLESCKSSYETEQKAAEEARKEAERKAKEPLKL
ncbi:hypothetical protein Emin_0838 [Elusimicrobium minutum Pei191]|uniref:DNA-directed RNA polymerase subunit omega n=1 Tax=Elusimicrobium minutum (strain Pei191) TaxID=445932 RepID=B2KCZ7_ELUMP|nr:hypothetical protein [Elusimicrobium minutum]ACC98393.1 hypothetical protein Emin_0838 [Elusimicrobium minutum Pei191]